MIQDITICRIPIFSLIQKGINIIRKLSSKEKNEEFDRLYHLYMLIKLKCPDGGSQYIRMERNQTFEINPATDSDLKANLKGGECISSPHPQNTTLNDFIGRVIVKQGKDFWRYDAVTNNCQDMVISVLKESGVLTDSVKKFVKQNTNDLLPGTIGRIAKAITDKAHGFDVLLKGKGRGKIGCGCCRGGKCSLGLKGGCLTCGGKNKLITPPFY